MAGYGVLRLAYLGHIAALTGVYFVAARVGLAMAVVHPSATAIWPPSGIALAAILLFGYRLWPGILLGAFLANLTTAGSVGTSIGVAVGNTLEGVIGAYLVNRFANGRKVFDRPQDVLKFAILAGFGSTTVSATLGASSLALGGFAGWSDFGRIWLTWWLGDAIGTLIVAPVLILWTAMPRIRWTRKEVTEAVLLLIALALLSHVVFSRPPFLGIEAQSIKFVCLPILFWAAYRFGRRETALASLLISGIALWETLRASDGGKLQNDYLLVLHLFFGVGAVTSLTLAAAVSERDRLVRDLRDALDDLEALRNPGREGKGRGSREPSAPSGARKEKSDPKTLQGGTRIPIEDLQRLVGHIRVQRANLEARYEDLRKTRDTLKAARDPDADLYRWAPIGHITLAPTGEIREANRAAIDLLGTRRDEMRSQKLADFVVPECRQVLTRHLKTVFATHERQTCELGFVTGDGRDQFVRLDSCSDRVEGGRGTICRTFLLDVTERKRAEEEIRRQHDTIVQKQRELRLLSAQLLTAAEEERQRIAADLHDDAGQRLAAADMEMALLRRRLAEMFPPFAEALEGVRGKIAGVFSDLHRLTHELHPIVLQNLGLWAALRALCEDFERQHGIAVRVRGRNLSTPILGPVALGLYRIAQEALHNVSRHAGTRHVRVTLSRSPRCLGLCMADSGRGFDITAANQAGRGLGLVSMERRALALGGKLSVRSSPGKGTHVHVLVRSTPDA